MALEWIVGSVFGVVALLANVLLIPFVITYSKRKNWLDRPNTRTLHQDPVPRLGGVGMFFSIVITLAALTIWLASTGNLPEELTFSTPLVLLFLGMIAIHVLGVLDDFVELRAVYKLVLQILAAMLALGAGLSFDHLSLPFTPLNLDLGPFAPLVTLVWIVAITNAVNLIDGMDGLAGGFSVICLVGIGGYSFLSGNLLVGFVSWIAAGAVLGFLVHNLPPAKIFMGDSGSLLLGYLLAVLPLMGAHSLQSELWLLPVVLVLIPIGDTVAAILRRLRENRPVWSPDKFHMHHKLLAMGLGTRQVLALVYSSALLTSVPIWLAGAFHSVVVNTISSLAASGLILVLFSLLHFRHKKFLTSRTPHEPPKTPLHQ